MNEGGSTKKAASAGLLMFRGRGAELEVLLVHPGGPFFARKDAGIWTLPKGLLEANENALTAARREFTEETSFPTPATAGALDSAYIALGNITQKGGKLVHAWAFEGDCDPAQLVSNEFEMDWPPRSGRKQRFPEVDRGAWFDPPQASTKINPAQVPFLERLIESLLAP